MLRNALVKTIFEDLQAMNLLCTVITVCVGVICAYEHAFLKLYLHVKARSQAFGHCIWMRILGFSLRAHLEDL